MADRQPEERRGNQPQPDAARAALRARAGWAGYWFPLLLFGGLVALSVPLAVLASPGPPTGFRVLTGNVYTTLPQAMYLGGGFAFRPFPFPLGWYWVGAQIAGVLGTAAWLRWRGRRAGSRPRLPGYLATGLALAAATAALPLLAWGTPMPLQSNGPGMQAWIWLDTSWRLGTFALLAIAMSLGMLARIGRSRPLAVITGLYTAAVCLAGWIDLRQAVTLPAPYPFGDRAVLLPAAMLLAGAGILAAAGLRAARSHRGSLSHAP